MTDLFAQLAHRVDAWVCSPYAFAIAVLTVCVWGITGPLFGWSDTWQMVINTGTTIVTFLMVFLIQNAQARSTKALHLKLDELVLANEQARNRFLAVESKTDEELDRDRVAFERIAKE